MKKIILIRHGSLSDKFKNCYVGSMDLPLSSKGLSEACAIGEFIQDIECEEYFASPMLRVRQTLENALPEKTTQQVKYLDELREIDFGEWEGKTFKEICKEYPEKVEEWTEGKEDFCFPGGSSLKQFFKGIERFKKRLQESKASTIIVFAHGGVILYLICSLLGLSKDKMLCFKINRGSISTLQLFENGCAVLNGLNFKPEINING